MRQHFITRENRHCLTLFFAGWGMDETPFLHLPATNTDRMICYDYRDLSFDSDLLQGYTHITLIAWSMGVWAATQVMHRQPSLPIVQSVAVNGTPYPIDEAKGISPAIFNGTLQGLNEETLRKFQRRMCGSSDEYKAFCDVQPKRSVTELKEELAAIGKQYTALPAATFRWQQAVIGSGDRIFLPDNQRAAWHDDSSSPLIKEVDAPHYSKELFECLFTQHAYPVTSDNRA